MAPASGLTRWSTHIPISPVCILCLFLAPLYALANRGLDISAGLDLLWRNNINPAKVALGLGFYGGSFTLKYASCTTPECAFANDAGLQGSSGGANPGTYTGTSGILSDYEIVRILGTSSPQVAYDATAAVNWMTWNGNQWYAQMVGPLLAASR